MMERPYFNLIRLALSQKRFWWLSAASGLLLLSLATASAWAAGSAKYTYDSLGRLTKVEYSSGVVVVYTYDAAGNRTGHVVSGAPN